MQNIDAKPIDTSQPLVSVVIATYNMGQYLAQAVDSILQQTWQNLEIIVVDDGSKDNTSDVMSQYSNNAKVTYIKNENQGQPKAKNCGIKKTRGEFIAFCDADDFWEPNKLEIQMPLFASPSIGVVYSEISNIDEHNKRYAHELSGRHHTGKVTDFMLMENFVPFGTSVIRRECIEKNGIFDEQFRMGIDWDLWLRYSLDWEFAYTPERTYVYRAWSGQMSSNYRGRYEHAFKILHHFIEKHGARLNAKRIATAIADIYINQAIAIAINEKKFAEPLRDILQGIKHDPSYFYGWKSLLKLLLKRY
jgi:glycosyltransferase involved in cell wall biosynthesis